MKGMELKRAVCTNCGNELEVDYKKSIGQCDACGSKFVIENAIKLNKVEVDRTKELSNLRKLLTEAVKTYDYRTIERMSDQIRSMIPDDFRANYYHAFACQHLNRPKYIKSFYTDFDVLYTDDERNEVIEHLIHNCDLRDRKEVFSFIEQIDKDKINLFNEVFKKRVAVEDNYAIISRDVFICHRSTDISIASKLVEYLEKDGNQCWISSRNLRPNDSENYWSNIEDAIRTCHVFLVISSQDSMLSSDVRQEMELALKFNKPRIEVKIDDSDHTSYFKHYFDGLKWVDAFTNPEKAFITTQQRVFEALKAAKTRKSLTPSNNPSNQSTWIDHKGGWGYRLLYTLYILSSCFALLITSVLLLQSGLYSDSSLEIVLLPLFAIVVVLIPVEYIFDKGYFRKFKLKRRKSLRYLPPWLFIILIGGIVGYYHFSTYDPDEGSNFLLFTIPVLQFIFPMYVLNRLRNSEQIAPIRYTGGYWLLILPSVLTVVGFIVELFSVF